MSTGLDPEFFIGRSTRGVVPAPLLIPDSASETDATIAYDNAAVEIRHHDPRCLTTLNSSIKGSIQKVIRDHFETQVSDKNPQTMILSPAVKLDQSYLDLAELREFGCDPAYQLNERGSPIQFKAGPDPDSPWRCAGYHVHQSVEDHPDYPGDVPPARLAEDVKLADIFLGCLDVMMNEQLNYNNEAKVRRSMGYGRAGEFRTRPFGVEYRVLSPWPLHSPMTTWFIHSAMRQIFGYDSEKNTHIEGSTMMRGRVKEILLDTVDWKDAFHAINEQDAKLAYDVWSKAVRTVCDLVGTADVITPSLTNDGHNALTPDNLKRMHFVVTRMNPGMYLTAGMRVHNRWLAGVRSPANSSGDIQYAWPSGSKDLIKHHRVHSSWTQFENDWPDVKDPFQTRRFGRRH